MWERGRREGGHSTTGQRGFRGKQDGSLNLTTVRNLSLCHSIAPLPYHAIISLCQPFIIPCIHLPKRSILFPSSLFSSFIFLSVFSFSLLLSIIQAKNCRKMGEITCWLSETQRWTLNELTITLVRRHSGLSWSMRYASNFFKKMWFFLRPKKKN